MLADLATASWETIVHRTLMIAQNTCPLAEYQRMVAEKVEAYAMSMEQLLNGGWTSPAALLAPWHSCAQANAKRLRMK
jgi:hypothetical protein